MCHLIDVFLLIYSNKISIIKIFQMKEMDSLDFDFI